MTAAPRRWSLKLDPVSLAVLVEALDLWVASTRQTHETGHRLIRKDRLDAGEALLEQLNTVHAAIAEGTPSSGVVAQGIEDRATTVISSTPRPVPATETPTVPYPLPMNAEAVSYRALAQLLHRMATAVDAGALVQDALRAAAEHDLPEIVESETNIPAIVRG